MNKDKKQKVYILLSLVILIIEAIIGFFVHDNFIRPYGGDFFAVVLVYCLLRYFSSISINLGAITALIFACLIELGQYLHISSKIGLKSSIFIKATIGSSFDWKDIAIYCMSIILVLFFEKIIKIAKYS